jgi:hypothetical protein
VINAIRDHLAEYSIVTAVDAMVLSNCSGVVADQVTNGCQRLRACLAALGAQLRMLKAAGFDRMVNALLRMQRTSKRVRYGIANQLRDNSRFSIMEALVNFFALRPTFTFLGLRVVWYIYLFNTLVQT